MARQRRRGFKAPELRGTIGTLLRTTLQQAGAVLERGAREGRARLDDLRADRRRQDALAELGEIVLELIRKGEIELSELPEARAIVAQLDELDADIPDEDRITIAPPSSRRRFDDRETNDGTVSADTWVPPSRRADRPTSVWRPAVEHAASPEPAGPAPAPRAGGITFDDPNDEDDDLAEYMHPDDVPAKPGSDEP
jgi:hypothetical protein